MMEEMLNENYFQQIDYTSDNFVCLTISEIVISNLFFKK
tara:strand:+ start:363 stop:479 length:117 start_codon:yes stop_codon:yes gene_type:complete